MPYIDVKFAIVAQIDRNAQKTLGRVELELNSPYILTSRDQAAIVPQWECSSARAARCIRHVGE